MIWTVGHSTRTVDEFCELLGDHRIELLADVRHFPGSKRVPWAMRGTLTATLDERGIAYEHFEDLGGFRKPVAKSANMGWRNSAFRGYADHMASTRFVGALDLLIRRARTARTAIMCAEAVPWKCHRSLLSDCLLARGIRVVHILGVGKTQDHRLTPFARVHGLRVTYPAPQKDV